jgi:tetratricopeptide (TPR) repeat protein
MLRVTFNRDWVSRRMGEVTVMGVLVLAYLLTGCAPPERRGREARVERTAPPAQVATVSHEIPATAPVPSAPVVMGPVTYEVAEAAFREGRYDEAVVLFTSYVEGKPDNAWGHYMRGLSAWKAGDYATAETAYDAALERDPQHLKSMLGLARVLIETNRAADALEELELAVQVDSSSQVLRLKGRAYDELDLVDEAADAYLAAIARDDTDVWALNNLGFLYIRVGRETSAIGPLARAAALAPDNATFQNNLGVALERSGFAGTAAEAFRAALAADSTFAKAGVNLERVEARGVDLDITADLATMAQAFLDDVIAWRRVAAAAIEPEPFFPDSIVPEWDR